MDATGEPMIRLEAVSKRFPDGTVAVHSLDLDVGRAEVCVLVGPSGCGKTTTMRMVNRLIEPSSGRIFLDGQDVTHSDPVLLRRRMGYVIQQVGLFPHLTIEANVGTVPALLGWDRKRVRARVRELLERHPQVCCMVAHPVPRQPRVGRPRESVIHRGPQQGRQGRDHEWTLPVSR